MNGYPNPNLTANIYQHLNRMSYSPIDNYIVPGLSSYLLAQDPDSSQKVRIFRNSRAQNAHITPHNHRFDLACLVIQGSVKNTLYRAVSSDGPTRDEFTASGLNYEGEAGKYSLKEIGQSFYRTESSSYVAGQWYFMKAHEIHSIVFSYDAEVLVFEGQSVTDETIILEPFQNGETIRTFKVEDWMFQKA